MSAKGLRGGTVPAVPGLGTARGRGSGLSTDTLPGELAWGSDGGRLLGEAVFPAQTWPALTQGMGGKSGPGVGCAAGWEGSSCRLQCGVGCAGVPGRRLDARDRGRHCRAKPF